MVFLLRAVFWLAVVFMFMPAGARPSLSAALDQAQAAVEQQAALDRKAAPGEINPAKLSDARATLANVDLVKVDLAGAASAVRQAGTFCLAHRDTCRAGAQAGLQAGLAAIGATQDTRTAAR